MESSDSPMLEELGQALLDQRIQVLSDTEGFGERPGHKSRLYLHLVDLSKYLRSLGITMHDDVQIDSISAQKLRGMVASILSDLEMSGRGPSYEIGPQSSTTEAYSILCYALSILTNNESDLQAKYDELIESMTDLAVTNDLYQTTIASKESLRIENEELKERIALLEQYAFQVQSEPAPVEFRVVKDDSLKAKIKDLEQENERLRQLNQELLANSGPQVQLVPEEKSPQVFVLETEVESLKRQIRDLRLEGEASKNKATDLRLELSTVASERNDLKILTEELKMQINKMSLAMDSPDDHAEVDNLKDELELKNEEVSNLKAALSELSKQMDDMNRELAEQSNIRNGVLAILHKQNSALLEFQRLSKPKAEPKPETRSVDVQAQLDLPVQIQERIIEKTVEIDDGKYERLASYLGKTLQFLTQISDSDELQRCLTAGESQVGDFKALLVGHCNKVSAFMEENGYNASYDDIDIETADVDELRAAIRQSHAVNEILVKHSSELRNQAEYHLADANKLRFQLSDLEEKTREEIEEKEMEFDNQILEREEFMQRIRDILKQKPKDYKITGKIKARFVQNAAEVMAGLFEECQAALENCESMELFNKQIEESMSRFIASTNSLIPERDGVLSTLETHKELLGVFLDGEEEECEYEVEEDQPECAIIVQQEDEIEKLKKKLKRQKGVNSAAEKQIRVMEASIDEKDHEIHSLRDSLSALTDKLKSVEAQMTENGEQFDEVQSAHHARLEEIEASFNRKLEEVKQSKDEEMEELKNQNKEAIQAVQLSAKQQKRAMKEEIAKLSGQIVTGQQHAESIKSHYESILTDLKEKCDTARESEAKLSKLYHQADLQCKEMKSEVLAARVENRVLEARLKTEGERYERQMAMLEAKTKLTLMDMESENERKLDDTRSELESNFSDFLVSICQEFKDFCDFSSPISRSSVLSMLKRALAHYTSAVDEVQHLRNTFDIESGVSLAAHFDREISNLTRKLQEAPVEPEPKVVKVPDDSWKLWSNRLASLITGKVCVGKPDAELQNLIEEAILDAIGNRKLWQKVDLLRTEKQLMLQGAAVPKLSFVVPRLRTIMTIAIGLTRLQKMSGHMKVRLSCQERAPQGEVAQQQRKVFPILSITRD